MFTTHKKLLLGCMLAIAVIIGIGGLWLVADDPENIIANNEATEFSVALVGLMSGREGREMRAAVELLLSRYNNAQRDKRRRLSLKVFDDREEVEQAIVVAQQIVDDPSIVAVIGHTLSSTSLAAAPIYAAAGMPVVTPSATSPLLTEGYSNYFSSIFSDRVQGRFMADYAKLALSSQTTISIVDDSSYGKHLSIAFHERTQQLGIANNGVVAVGEDTFKDESARSAFLEKLESIGLLSGALPVIFTTQKHAYAVVKTLREGGYRGPMLGPDALGSNGFALRFKHLPKNREIPDFYVKKLYVTVPFIAEMSNVYVQDIIQRLELGNGTLEFWVAPYAYDAAKLVTTALQRSQTSPNRSAILEQLTRLTTTPETIGTIEGAVGPIRLNQFGAAERSITIGMFRQGLTASLLQLRTDPEAVNASPQLKAIVHTGVQLKNIRSVDVDKNSAEIEFDIWFRYQSDFQPRQLLFKNALEPLRLGRPVQDVIWNDIHYQRFEVSAPFKINYSIVPEHYQHQMLELLFYQNSREGSNVIFVPDSLGLPATSGKDYVDYLSDRLLEDNNWMILKAVLKEDKRRLPSMGDPELVATRAVELQQPGIHFSAQIAPKVGSWRRSIAFNYIGWLAGFMVVATLLFRVRLNSAKLQAIPRTASSLFVILTLATLFVCESAVMRHLSILNDRSLIIPALLVFDCLWWLIPAMLINLMIGKFIWAPLEAATSQAVPKVVKGFITFILMTLAVFAIIAFVFNHQVTSLLATSGVIAMIIGLAIQMNISNIFSGIAMNIEQLFRPGDWIKLGDTAGKVIDVSWRTTKIRTLNNTIMSVPNALAAEQSIENFSYPSNVFKIYEVLHFSLEHDPQHITDLLQDGLKLVSPADGRDRLGFISAEYAGIDRYGQKFIIGFDCPDGAGQLALTHRVMVVVFQVLKRCGITPVTRDFSKHADHDEETKATAIESLINEVELFEPLGEEGRAKLIAQAISRNYSADEIVFSQGDTGDSLFLIVEGVLAVLVTIEGKAEPLEVARLGAGQFFGEMTLLTGEPRTATIKAMGRVQLYEITREVIAPLLATSEDMTHQISEIMADRQMKTKMKIEKNSNYEEERNKIKGSLFKLITRLFKG